MRLHLAYIAGFLDADGCISASMIVANKLSKSMSMFTTLQFSNQNFQVLSDIRETLESGVIRAYSTGYSGAFRLDIRRKEQRHALGLLIPHLRVKKEQGELLLQLLNTNSGTHYYRVPAEIQKLRQEIVTRIQMLNKRDSKAYRSKWVNSVNGSSNVTVDGEPIPSQAAEGEVGSAEGVTTSRVSPNNNPDHECPPRKGRDSLNSTVM